MTQAVKVLNGGIVFQVLLELAMANAQIQVDKAFFDLRGWCRQGYRMM